MTVEMIVELIATLGFPIVCVIALAFFVYKVYNQSVDREKTLMAEIVENRKVNEKAIETIALYAEKLETIQTDIKEIKTDITILTAKYEV